MDRRGFLGMMGFVAAAGWFGLKGLFGISEGGGHKEAMYYTRLDDKVSTASAADDTSRRAI